MVSCCLRALAVYYLVTCLFVLMDKHNLSCIVYCQSLPQLSHGTHTLSNNSFIYSLDIGQNSLNLVTDNVTCCNDSYVGGWRDESGRPVDRTACLYVTRGFRVISLHRKRDCKDHTSGLWRCDIPNSSGEMQSLYVYISNNSEYGKLYHLSCINSTY